MTPPGLHHTLRAARHAKGISQRQLADLAGVSDCTVRRFETYGRVLKVHTLLKIAAVLGYDVRVTVAPKETA